MRVCLLDLEVPASTAPEPGADSRLGRKLLRTGLERLGYPPRFVEQLRYDTLGKPRLPAPLAFTLSHCAGRVLCALSADGPVGVDVEAADTAPISGFRLYFNARERAWAGSDAKRFLTVWTRKEAVSKAAGSAGLRRFPWMDALNAGVELDGQVWHTVTLTLGSGFVGHLACQAPDPLLEHLKIAPETLL